MNSTVLIVDDESPARERLAQMIADISGFDVIGQARNGRETLEQVQTLDPDIVLLDIRMPEIDGIEAARHLSQIEAGPAVVFTTAFDEYAIDAFDAQAIGYLLKPVRRERLERALQHAARLARPQLEALSRDTGPAGARTNLCVRKADELKLIPIDEVIYFQADQKYVTVRHTAGEDLIDDSLRVLADEFSDKFIRIHRSVLIAVAHLERMEKAADGQHLVWLKNCQQPLPVSRRHLTAVKTCLKRAR